MERKLCGMLIRAVAFWAAFSVRAGEPELSGYSGFCDGDIVNDAVVDFSGLSLRGDAGLYYHAVDSLTHETLRGAAGIRRDFVTDPSGATPSYTGLIMAKEMYTAGRRPKLPDTYSYSYDRLGRLTAAKYSAANVLINFSTTYSYDLQGNMLRLTRMGLTAPGRYGEVDNVTATYTGNQLHTLRDDAHEVLLEASMDVSSGTYSSGSFAYDANGNMTRDMSREITDMEYNALNLPCRVTFAGGSHIDWLYSAAGQKLRQTVISVRGDTLSRRDYLGPYLFTDNEFDRYETAEGYITLDDVYHAYIPDYQGNIVGVYNTSSVALEQTTDYYPYGLPFADASNPTSNRRKYGAKELTPDLGLNAYDFEARTLSPAFPMFSQPDLMAEKYYPLSPYLYCAGNPINNIDPKGCKIEGVSKDDISFYFTQIKIVLADKKFKPFVDALKIKGKKLEFDKNADVETIVNNLNMTDDESCFIHTLKDAIFNPKTIELEFINDDEIASTKGSDYIRISNTFYRIVKMFNNIFLDAYGKAITVPTNKGAYVLALKNDPNVTSNTFHESLGHGYSLILNLIKSHNENAVRMDNVVRRILKKSQRDGKDHEGEILSPYILPSYQ